MSFLKPDPLSKNPLYRIRQISFYPLAILAVAILALTACIKEEFNADLLNTGVQISLGVAAPIGTAHYKIEELFTDSIVPDEFTVGTDGFITMRYSQEISSPRADDLFTFNDVSFSFQLDNGTTPIVLNPSTPLNILDTIRVPLTIAEDASTEIDSVIIDSLTISLSGTSPLEGSVSIRPFGVFEYLNENNSPQTVSNTTIRLEHTTYNNELLIEYRVTISSTSGTILAGQNIASLNIRITDIDYRAAYGYLGQFSVPTPLQTMTIDLLDPVENGSFHFEDASLQIGTSNSFGLPVEVLMYQLQATGRDGQDEFITSATEPGLASPWLINSPAAGQEGQYAEASVTLTTSNTNLFDVLESSPVDISYGANGSCNPAGVDHTNFLLDSSRIDVTADLTLPIYGYADLLLIRDTLDFVFNDFYENPPEEIESLTFRLNFTNGLPVNVNFQAYFADQAGTILDSLFTDKDHLVAGALDTDGDGKADPVDSGPVEVVIDRDRIDGISSTSYIFLTGRFTTVGFEPAPPENVRFYTDYFFTAYLGAIVALDMNSADF